MTHREPCFFEMEPLHYNHFPPIATEQGPHFSNSSSKSRNLPKHTGTILIEAPLDPDSDYRETLQSFQAQFRGATFKHKAWESSKLEYFQTKRQRNIPTWRRDPIARSLSKQESNRGLKYRYKTFRYKGPLASDPEDKNKDVVSKNDLNLPHLYSNALITRSMELSALSSSDTASSSFRWNVNQSRPEHRDRISGERTESEGEEAFPEDDPIRMGMSKVFKDPVRYTNKDTFQISNNHHASINGRGHLDEDKIFRLYHFPRVDGRALLRASDAKNKSICDNPDAGLSSERTPELNSAMDDPFGLLEACRNARVRERGLHVQEDPTSSDTHHVHDVSNDVITMAAGEDDDTVDEVDFDDDEEGMKGCDTTDTNLPLFDVSKETPNTTPRRSNNLSEKLPLVSPTGSVFFKKLDYKSIIGDKPIIYPDCYDQYARDSLPKITDSGKDADYAKSRRKVRF